MERWLSKLSDRKDIAIALYARFPTEMAYGNHVIQIAKAFSKNNCNVNIYYPKTYNSKTLKETPEEYYGQIRNVNYVMIDNRDITSYKIYNLLPSILKKLLFSLSTFMWAKKLKNNQGETIVWSTNPNILLIVKKFFDVTIYEKHGVARFIQKFSISRLKKDKNVYLIAVTKQSLNDLNKSINKPLYLPNGVDRELFKPVVSKNEIIKIFENLITASLNMEKLPNFFQASSSEMFGPNNLNMLNEKSSFNPISPYAVGKLHNHNKVLELAKQYSWNIKSGIMFNHESEFRKNNYFFTKVINAAKKIKKNEIKKLSLGSLDYCRDWTFSGDVVAAAKGKTRRGRKPKAKK